MATVFQGCASIAHVEGTVIGSTAAVAVEVLGGRTLCRTPPRKVASSAVVAVTFLLPVPFMAQQQPHLLRVRNPWRALWRGQHSAAFSGGFATMENVQLR